MGGVEFSIRYRTCLPVLDNPFVNRFKPIKLVFWQLQLLGIWDISVQVQLQ